MNHQPLIPHGSDLGPVQVSPLDQPPQIFADGLARRKVNRKMLIDWIRDALVEGHDYGRFSIHGKMTKPSLFKPGAEKICGMLGVIAQFPTLADYERAVLEGFTIQQIILRCELVNGAGLVIANGMGARSVSSDCDLNKALKMAGKSAHIDATLRMAGLSEIFTQDLEDHTEAQSAVKPARRTPSVPSPASNPLFAVPAEGPQIEAVCQSLDACVTLQEVYGLVKKYDPKSPGYQVLVDYGKVLKPLLTESLSILQLDEMIEAIRNPNPDHPGHLNGVLADRAVRKIMEYAKKQEAISC